MATDWNIVAKALLHPTVLRVIELCEQQTRSPRQMADMLGLPLGAVSYHVRSLADKDMLVLVHTEPRRGAIEHYYRLSPAFKKGRKTAANAATSGDDSPGEMQDASQAA